MKIKLDMPVFSHFFWGTGEVVVVDFIGLSISCQVTV